MSVRNSNSLFEHNIWEDTDMECHVVEYPVIDLTDSSAEMSDAESSSEIWYDTAVSDIAESDIAESEVAESEVAG